MYIHDFFNVPAEFRFPSLVLVTPPPGPEGRFLFFATSNNIQQKLESTDKGNAANQYQTDHLPKRVPPHFSKSFPFESNYEDDRASREYPPMEKLETRAFNRALNLNRLKGMNSVSIDSS